MPFIPVPNTAMAELVYTFKSNRYENTLYFLFAAPPTDAELTSLAGDLATWWITNMAPELVDDIALDMIKMTSLQTATANFQEFTDGLPQSGGDAGDPLPPQDAMVVTIKTTTRGRSYRGRNYIVGLPEDTQSGGEWSVGIMGAIEGAYAELVAVATANNVDWVVVSRYSGVNPVTGQPIPRVTGITTPVSSFAARPIVATQTRRKLGRGQ